MADELLGACGRAREASCALARLTRAEKDATLRAMADALERDAAAILAANAEDVAAARGAGMKEALVDRLLLTEDRIRSMAAALRETAGLPDPVGTVVAEKRLRSGLRLVTRRVPFGVVAVVYESRPNVTSDIAGLCLKSGNAVLLKGGSDAARSNGAIVASLASAAGVTDAVQLLPAERTLLRRLLRMECEVDLVIPRGGAGLLRFVREHALVPVIETGTGNCHVYVDRAADQEMALRILVNAKTQRPGVCNAAEKLLVHREVARGFLPKAQAALEGVELRGCAETVGIIGCAPAIAEDWDTEYLDLVLGVKVVRDVEEAVAHINRHGTRHSEAIVTADAAAARTFLAEVDAAAVYHNASTRFTDGGEFGLGMEIGISTQKLHVRGPMGLAALTTTKHELRGDGQIRE